VVKDGKVVKETVYGHADLQLGSKVTPQTLFQIASVTKLFTGVALGRLQEQHKISFDDPVGRYLSDLPASWQTVTLRQMATHTSGLPDVITDSQHDLTSEELKRTPEEALAYAEKKPLVAQSGTEFAYDQTGYLLLSRVVEKVTGKPFRTAVRELVLAPAGMNDTRWADGREIVAGRSDMYSVLWRKAVENALLFSYPGYFDAAAGINTNIADFEKFSIARQRGDVLSPDAMGKTWGVTHYADGSVANIAPMMGSPGVLTPNIGGFLATDASDEHPREWMEGGSAASYFYFPKDKVAVIVLTNLQGAPVSPLAEKIAGFYIPGMKMLLGE
jgi:CubicO group peptidase (beta-lactamase class C family)